MMMHITTGESVAGFVRFMDPYPYGLSLGKTEEEVGEMDRDYLYIDTFNASSDHRNEPGHSPRAG